MIARKQGAGKVALFAAFLAALVVTVFWILTQLAAGNDERDQQATEISALESGLDEANDRLAEQGEPRVSVPEVDTTDDTDTPAIIRPGEDGEDGEDGASGSDGLDGSTGASGADGEDGDDGAPGSDGEDGNAGASGADGAAGDDGANGAPGPPGRGVRDVTCLATGDWVVTYTDGQTSTAAGPCRGTDGSNGTDGANGSDGAKGDQGEPGEQGPPGPAGTATPGTYTCPVGQYMTGFTVAENGDVTTQCDTPGLLGLE